MGSKLVVALSEQRGNITTNPEGLSPDTSRPIQQVASISTDATASNPVQQVASTKTGEVGGASTSVPVEQRAAPDFAGNPPVPGDEAVIEQRVAGTAASPVRSSEEYDTLEQFAKTTAVEPLQQFEIKRDTTANGTPIEQVTGIENTITIQQFDFIESIFPPCGSIKNPTTTNLLWRIRDFGFSFDTSTLIFKVQGLEVQDSPSFSIIDLGTGLELFYDPPVDFPFDSEIEVFVQISDTAVPANTFFVRCSWRTVPDTGAPVVFNVVPCGQSGVSVTAPVSFDVTDFGLGVDPSSIKLSIEGITVCSGITLDAVNFPGSGSGFHVTWEHPSEPFRFGSNVTVSIEASDLSSPPNSTFFVCDFDTEESKPPIFMNFDPFPCESFVDVQTGLTFEVYGDMHGVDISTLKVFVDSAGRRVIVTPRILRSD